jgi:hypothetical protein
MASGNIMAQIRKGMEVTTADGRTLGKVAHVWFGIDPARADQRCDEEECSRLEVHLGRRGGTRYIPYSAIAGVSGQTVSLSATEATVNDKLWHQRPSWMPTEEADADFDHLFRPHPDHGSR